MSCSSKRESTVQCTCVPPKQHTVAEEERHEETEAAHEGEHVNPCWLECAPAAGQEVVGERRHRDHVSLEPLDTGRWIVRLKVASPKGEAWSTEEQLP